MNDRVIYIGIGIVGWFGTILVAKVFRGASSNKSVVRCSNIVKQEIKGIRRYNKSINDSVK